MTDTKHQSFSLPGRVALITGAAARIGAEIARLLHGEGVDLLLHYRRSADAAAALAQELKQARPDSVRLVCCDLNAPEAIGSITRAVGDFRDRLDILVNNASSFYPRALGQVSDADWDDLIGSNLRAPFFLTQALAPQLRESRGCVVNLVDIHAERPLAGYPVYCIAKAGNAMMVKALARELGPEVRVNGIAPGAILWPNQDGAGQDEGEKAEILERTALKRLGSAQDIARILLFLVRDAPYMTGQLISVDGGRTLQQ